MSDIDQINERYAPPSTGQKAANFTGYTLLSKIISYIIAGVTLIVVARVLGPALYGVYTVAVSVAAIFRIVANFGIATAFTKYTAEYMSKGDIKKIGTVTSDGLFALLIIGGVVTAIAFALSGPIAAYTLHSSSYAYIIQLASFIVLISTIDISLTNVITGFNDGKYFAAATVAQLAVQSAISIALVFAGFGALAPLAGFTLGWIASIIVSVYYIYFVRRVGLEMPSFKRIKNLLKFSIPLEVSSMQTSLTSNIYVIVLGIFATTAVVGNLGIAVKAGTLISVLIDSISISLLPAFTITITEKIKGANIGKSYNYAIFISFVLMTPVLLSVALLSKQFIFVAFSGKYPLAPLYLSIISIGILVSVIGSYASTLLISGHKPKDLLKSTTLLTLIQLAAIGLLIPAFQGIGAIVAMYAITPVLSAVIYTYTSKRALNIAFEFRRLYKVILAGLICIAPLVPLMLLLKGDYIAILVSAAIIEIALYPPILALIKGISIDDIEILKKITSNLPVANRIVASLADYSAHFIRN